MTYTCFELETHDGIAQLRLSRPNELNSMISAFWSELPAAVEELESLESTRVIVILSTGKHFSSGMDFSVFQSGEHLNTRTAVDRDRMRRLVLKLQDSFNCFEQCRVPVIAAVQGACIGAAVDLISACDLRYATSSAYFCIQEINLAMMADLGTLQRLPKLIPEGVARELAYTGDKLTAERAKQLGLLNDIFESDEEMHKQVMAVAAKIAARSPLAVAASKQAITYARDHAVADSLRNAADVQSGIFDVLQVQECLKARNEKREPVFPNLHSIRVGV